MNIYCGFLYPRKQKLKSLVEMLQIQVSNSANEYKRKYEEELIIVLWN